MEDEHVSWFLAVESGTVWIVWQYLLHVKVFFAVSA